MNTPLKAIIGSVLCAGVLFFLADCSAGSRAHYLATVSGKEYQPPYTTFSTDSDGNLQSSHHDEQYHVICAANDGHLFDVHTHRSIYHSVTNGQRVIVSTRVGRWTGINYLASVAQAQAEK